VPVGTRDSCRVRESGAPEQGDTQKYTNPSHDLSPCDPAGVAGSYRTPAASKQRHTFH